MPTDEVQQLPLPSLLKTYLRFRGGLDREDQKRYSWCTRFFFNSHWKKYGLIWNFRTQNLNLAEGSFPFILCKLIGSVLCGQMLLNMFIHFCTIACIVCIWCLLIKKVLVCFQTPFLVPLPSRPVDGDSCLLILVRGHLLGGWGWMHLPPIDEHGHGGSSRGWCCDDRRTARMHRDGGAGMQSL